MSTSMASTDGGVIVPSEGTAGAGIGGESGSSPAEVLPPTQGAELSSEIDLEKGTASSSATSPPTTTACGTFAPSPLPSPGAQGVDLNFGLGADTLFFESTTTPESNQIGGADMARFPSLDSEQGDAFTNSIPHSKLVLDETRIRGPAKAGGLFESTIRNSGTASHAHAEHQKRGRSGHAASSLASSCDNNNAASSCDNDDAEFPTEEPRMPKGYFNHENRARTMVHKSGAAESTWGALLSACSEQMGLSTPIGTLHRVARWKFGIFMYFEGDGMAAIATYISFVLYFASFLIYFYIAANETDQEGHGARYLTSDSFKKGHLSGSLIQYRPISIFFFNLTLQLISVSRIIFWVFLMVWGWLKKVTIQYFHQKEVGKQQLEPGADRDRLVWLAAARRDYIHQETKNIETKLSKSVGGLKKTASLLEWTNMLLTVMVMLPLINWDQYKYLWLPSFLHIWHAKFFFLILLKDRMTAIEAKNDAMSYRTKTYYDMIDLVLNVLAYIFTWVFLLAQFAMDFENDFVQQGKMSRANAGTMVPGETDPYDRGFSNWSNATGSWVNCSDAAANCSGGNVTIIGATPEVNTFNLLATFYFFVATVTTTGYGDIYAKNTTSVIMITILMFYSMYLALSQVPRIFRMLGNYEPQDGSYQKKGHRTHVVVVVGKMQSDHLREFLESVHVHSKYDEEDVPVIVVMSPYDTRAIQAAEFDTLEWRDRLIFLRGSAMDDRDLSRALVNEADSVFVLADRWNLAPEQADSDTVMRTRAINSFAPDVPQFVQIMLPTNKAQFHTDANITLITVEELRYALLGESAITPGLSTLITELGHSIPSTNIKDDLEKDFTLVEERLKRLQKNVQLHEDHPNDDPLVNVRIEEEQSHEAWELEKIKSELCASWVYADCTENSLFSKRVSAANSVWLRKVCGKYDRNGKYVGAEYGNAAFSALSYGIAFVGVKIGVSRGGFVPDQVVVNPMRINAAPFQIHEHDVIFYIARAPEHLLEETKEGTIGAAMASGWEDSVSAGDKGTADSDADANDGDGDGDDPGKSGGAGMSWTNWGHAPSLERGRERRSGRRDISESLTQQHHSRAIPQLHLLKDKMSTVDSDKAHGMAGMFSSVNTATITPMVQHMATMISESRQKQLNRMDHRASYSHDLSDGYGDYDTADGHRARGTMYNEVTMQATGRLETPTRDRLDGPSSAFMKDSLPSPLDKSFPNVLHSTKEARNTSNHSLIKARRLPQNTLYDNSPATAPVWMRDDESGEDQQCLNMEHQAHDIQHLLNPFTWKTAVRWDLRTMSGFVVIDLGAVDDFRLGVYELIRHCRRVRHFDERHTPDCIRPLVLVQPPGIWEQTKEHLKNFIATFPNVFYFKGTLSCNCNDSSLSDTLNSNPNLRYCLEKASVVMILKQKTSTSSVGTLKDSDHGMTGTSQCHEDHMVDGLSVALASRLAKHLPHKQTRLVLELSLRDNFGLVKNSLKSEIGMGTNRFGYIYNRSYQQGAVLTDTFVDIALGQAYLSGCGRDMIKVYSQLLSISDGKYISQGYSQANGFVGSIRITSQIFKSIAAHVGKSEFHMTLGLVTYDDACKYAIEILCALPIGLLFDYRSRSRTHASDQSSDRRQSATTTKFTSAPNTPRTAQAHGSYSDTNQLNDELDGTALRSPGPVGRSSSQEAKFRRASDIHRSQLTRNGQATFIEDRHRNLDPNEQSDPMDTQFAVLCNPPLMTPVKPGDWLYLINSPCPLPENPDDCNDVLDDNEGLCFTDYRAARRAAFVETSGTESSFSKASPRPSSRASSRASHAGGISSNMVNRLRQKVATIRTRTKPTELHRLRSLKSLSAIMRAGTGAVGYTEGDLQPEVISSAMDLATKKIQENSSRRSSSIAEGESHSKLAQDAVRSSTNASHDELRFLQSVEDMINQDDALTAFQENDGEDITESIDDGGDERFESGALDDLAVSFGTLPSRTSVVSLDPNTHVQQTML